MDKRWIRNGVFASSTIKLNGCVVSNPTEEQLRAAGYEVYEQQERVMTEQETLESERRKVMNSIDSYDRSSSVNTFMLNGHSRWIDSDLRNKISYAASALRHGGEDKIDIWFGTEKVTLSCDDAIDMLNKIEVYAKRTNDVTHRHKAELLALSTLDEVKSYDFQVGYPTPLAFYYTEL